jgi:hypothetical protein
MEDKGIAVASKEIKIDCPCCRAKLVIDSETQGILQAIPHKEAAPSLQDFLKADKHRGKDLDEKFAESKRMEDSRLKVLEKKFEWAKKNKDKLPQTPLPGIQWD